MRFWLSAVLSVCHWAGQAAGQQPPDQLHREALVWDCHSDLSYRALYENLDIGQRLPAGHVDIPRLQEGQVDVQTVALYVLNYLRADYDRAMNELRAVSKPGFDKLPIPAEVYLRIAIDHLSQGRDWPLENLPTIEAVLDHMDRAVRVAGVDHVGLGPDRYPRTPSPVGIRGVHDYPKLILGLKRRGYSDTDVRKILGGNFLRVWKAMTEKVSGER